MLATSAMYYPLRDNAFELLKVPNSRRIRHPFSHYSMAYGSVMKFSKRTEGLRRLNLAGRAFQEGPIRTVRTRMRLMGSQRFSRLRLRTLWNACTDSVK